MVLLNMDKDRLKLENGRYADQVNGLLDINKIDQKPMNEYANPKSFNPMAQSGRPGLNALKNRTSAPLADFLSVARN